MQSMISYDPKVIARHNPRLAYILECVRAPLVPRAYQVGVSFNTGTVNQTLPGTLQRPMANDAWITELEYTVRAENAWAGNPLKSQFDYYLVRAPYVDVDIRFNGRGPSDDIRVTSTFIPIETVAKAAGNPSPYDNVLGNWHVIQKDQDLQIDFNLRRALGVTEVPYIVTIVAKMYEINGCCLQDIEMGKARSCLSKMGYLDGGVDAQPGG
jgi:hypothetical protein